MEKDIECNKQGAVDVKKVKGIMRLGRAEYKSFAWEHSAKAQHIKADDEKSYIVKFKNNPQGTRILANEFIANSIARLIDIPCPCFSIMNIDKELLSYINKINGTNFEIGNQFASAYVEAKNLPDETKNAMNSKEWPKIVVFEALMQNIDCRQTHVLFYKDKKNKKNKFCVIDHGFAFKYEKWTNIKTDINRGELGMHFAMMFNDLHKNLIKNKALYGALDNIIETFKLNEDNVKQIINNPVLEEWGIDANDKEAVASYLGLFPKNALKIVEMLRK